MSFVQTSIYMRLPLNSERVNLSECVWLYVLRILFAFNSELYAATTTIHVNVPVPKTGRKEERAKKNVENMQRSM